MDGRPREPCEQPADTKLAALQHSKTLSNDGHISFVEIAKWLWAGFAGNSTVNEFPCITTLLQCHLRNPSQRLAVLIERGGVPNYENFRMRRHAQIVLNAHPSRVVGLYCQPLACGRGGHTGRPNHGFALDAFASHHDPVGADLIATLPQTDFDSEFFEPMLCGFRQLLCKGPE